MALKWKGRNFVRIFGRWRASEKIGNFLAGETCVGKRSLFYVLRASKNRRKRGCGSETGLERCAGVARVGKRSAAGERQLGAADGLTYNFRCNFYSCGSVCE